jgi:hypothetical protein
MMDLKLKIIIKKTMFLLLFSIIILGIGTAIGFFITYNLHYNLQDTLGFEAILLAVIGVMLSMKGNPFSGIRGMGQQNVNAQIYDNLETARLENDLTDYNKNFLKHHVTEFRIINLSFILGGIFIGILSYLVK